MKIRILCRILPVFLFFPIFLTAQNAGRATPVTATDDPAELARIILDEILNVLPSPPAIHLKEDRTRLNAVATMENERRYIVYHPDFVRSFQKNAQTRWSVYALFAHEVGHHVRNHDFTRMNDCELRKRYEKEADYFAGEVLNLLCATLDEATAGFRALEAPKEGASCYPSPTRREAFVQNGWLEKDDYWRKERGKHPCEDVIRFPLNAGKNAKHNWARNPEAILKGRRMEILYDVLPNKDIEQYRVYLAVDPQSLLAPDPTHLDWVGDSTKPGPRRTLYWYYEKDGYLRDDVRKADFLGVVAYAPNKVPKRTKAWQRGAYIAGNVLGAAALGLGLNYLNQYKTPYDRYKTDRDPASYLDEGTTREAVYQDANKQYKLGQYLCYGGGALIVGCNISWYFRGKEHKRAKALRLIGPKF